MINIGASQRESMNRSTEAIHRSCKSTIHIKS
jgi:hypothetical protein